MNYDIKKRCELSERFIVDQYVLRDQYRNIFQGDIAFSSEIIALRNEGDRVDTIDPTFQFVVMLVILILFFYDEYKVKFASRKS